jgi:hypothetical protein
MLCTSVWIGLTTAMRLHLAVERMERGVKGVGSDAHWFKCFFCIACRRDLCCAMLTPPLLLASRLVVRAGAVRG